MTARVKCGASIHAIFQLTVRRIQMLFSLKPSQSQGESFQLAGVRRFGGVREHPNTQTHSLTDWCFDRVIEKSFVIVKVKENHYSRKNWKFITMCILIYHFFALVLKCRFILTWSLVLYVFFCMCFYCKIEDHFPIHVLMRFVILSIKAKFSKLIFANFVLGKRT